MTDDENLGDFADADDYDLRDQTDTGVEFYSQLAKETGGPVLEIGCGTGRVSIPIARLGISITGLDIVAGMVKRAREKSAGLPAQWVVGDGRDFNLEERFRMVFLTGNTFQLFLTRRDQERLLQRVRVHLEDDGVLAFETRNPRWATREIWSMAGEEYSPIGAPGEGLFAYLEDSDGEQYRRTYTDAAGHEVREYLSQVYDHVTQVLHWTGRARWVEDGIAKERTTRTSVRYTFPQELEALLCYAGYEIVREYGDWNFEALDASSPSIIVVCRRRD